MCRKSGSNDYKLPFLLLFSALIIAGCSSDGSSEPDTVTPAETGADADTSIMNTDGTDTEPVAGTDAGTTDTDSGTTVNETETESVPGTDAGTVTDTDSGTTITATETGTDAGTATGTDAADMVDETDTGITDTGIGDVSISSPATVGEANCAALSAAGSTASIAGLYDYSVAFESIVVDTKYWEIDNNGSMTFYDYQQDAVGSGDNCYIISTGFRVLSPQGNNEFVNTEYINADESCEISVTQATITRSETEITATFVDTDDLDEDGDATELFTDILPVLNGFTTESFNACE